MIFKISEQIPIRDGGMFDDLGTAVQEFSQYPGFLSSHPSRFE